MIVQVIKDMGAFLSLLALSTVMFAVISTRLFHGIEMGGDGPDPENTFGTKIWVSYNLIIGEFGDYKDSIN